MAHDPVIRPAVRSDAPELAYLHALASGGMIEFIFGDVVPGMSAGELFAETLARDAEPYTWRSCMVADDNGSAIGKLHTFPADDETKTESDPRIPDERLLVLAPLFELEPGTRYISAVAVHPAHHERGLGRRFMELAETQARDHGFAEISLHVFEDNRRNRPL